MVTASVWQTLRILWALPATSFGLLVGLICLFAGGAVRRQGRTIEFWGRSVQIAFRLMLLRGPISAMTLGHVILGLDRETLDRCREHELVHVRQYECWGPFFIPAYLLCSLWLWLRGRNAYFDNPFERQAYEGTQD